MKIARMWIAPELLTQHIGLPSGTKILDASMYDEGGGHYVMLTVSHGDLKDVELEGDELPPIVLPTFKRQDPIVLVSWNQK